MIDQKLKTIAELVPLVKRLKKQGKKIVTTNGVFDIIHLGHAKYLEDAKKLGDVLLVGVNTDRCVKELKGDKRPINPLKSRAGVLAALESVDYVFSFGEKDPRLWIGKIRPDIHVKAADYKISQIIEKNTVEMEGGKVVLANMEKSYSSTKIIKKILDLYRK